MLVSFSMLQTVYNIKKIEFGRITNENSDSLKREKLISDIISLFNANKSEETPSTRRKKKLGIK